MGFRCKLRRAIDGTRTRDFHLGKVALYQLSHYRINTSVALEHCSLTTKTIIAWVEPAVNLFWKKIYNFYKRFLKVILK